MKLVGVGGFEPPTSWPQTRRSTKLSYTPTAISVGSSRPKGQSVTVAFQASRNWRTAASSCQRTWFGVKA